MANLAQLIKKIALEAVESSSPLRFVEGSIQSTSPLSLRLKKNSKLIIPSELITVADHLSSQKKNAVIVNDGGGESVTIEFESQLEVGNRVMVAVIQGGQSFFIIDKF